MRELKFLRLKYKSLDIIKTALHKNFYHISITKKVYENRQRDLTV